LVRKDVMNDHQGKPLREGCHEENGSDKCIFREKNNTNRNLARVTTKSKSRMQTVSNGCLVKEQGSGLKSVPMSETVTICSQC